MLKPDLIQKMSWDILYNEVIFLWSEFFGVYCENKD